jgi:phosphonate degradation associated HDIG domain protein
MLKNRALEIADKIIGLYKTVGLASYDGEDISQLEHDAQAAALAKNDGLDEETVLAAFLHDIGHLLESSNAQMADYGNHNHELIGAEYLKEHFFSKKLTALVEGHVAAKRYLCAVSPAYFNQLSVASKQTLVFQGGPMSDAEVKDFELNENKRWIIRLRTYDEAAKVVGQPTTDLSLYHRLIVEHLMKQS